MARILTGHRRGPDRLLSESFQRNDLGLRVYLSGCSRTYGRILERTGAPYTQKSCGIGAGSTITEQPFFCSRIHSERHALVNIPDTLLLFECTCEIALIIDEKFGIISKGWITIPDSKSLLQSRKIPLDLIIVDDTVAVFVPVSTETLTSRIIVYHCIGVKQGAVVEMSEMDGIHISTPLSVVRKNLKEI